MTVTPLKISLFEVVREDAGVGVFETYIKKKAMFTLCWCTYSFEMSFC